MEVRFRTDRLRKCYEHGKTRTREWGERIGRLYVQRIDMLLAARDAQTLRTLRALDFHALTGERKGEHALRLDGFYRLIVTFQDKGMTIVRVEEVSKHYDD